ncbi:MAG: hypothetical protein HYY84_20595 [Deltaproteobacteria bacterium]|nr:hypothetical protein [Deltaproteobacteria bacterium]
MAKKRHLIVFLVAIVGCKGSTQSDSNSINIISNVPSDLIASVRSAVARVEIVLDEPQGAFSLFASTGTPRAATSDEGYAVTAEIVDVDQDSKLEQRVTVIANPFSTRDSWSVFLVGGAIGDGFVLRGKLYRIDAGANELIAEAYAASDGLGNLIQFGGGLKTVVLNFNCATNVACREGAPDTILDRDAGPGALSNVANPTFAFSCTSPFCSFACNLDDAGFVPCASGWTGGTLMDGVHTFGVRATDDAGRADPTPAAMTWTIDGTRPMSALTSANWVAGEPVAFGTTVNIGGWASDNLSGVARVEVSVDGGATWFDATGLATWAASFAAGFFAHEVRVRATDDAGNVEVPDGGATLYAMGLPATDRFGADPVDFTAGCAGSGTYGLWEPTGVVYDSAYNRLHIVDSLNHRLVIYSTNPGTGLPAATPTWTIGQPSPQHCLLAESVSATSLNTPWGAYVNGSMVYVSDRFNNRVVGVRLEIIGSGLPAQEVYGQPDFTSRGDGGGAAGLTEPTGIAYASQSPTYLFVADTMNNRVVIYDLWQRDAGEPAIAVLGQSDFDGSVSACSAGGLSAPMGLAFDSTNRRLFVADRENSRVAVYQVPSNIDGGFPATWVLGQDNLTSCQGGTSEKRVSRPESVSYDDVSQRLYVSDTENHRVVVFDVAAIDAGESAIAVIGQPAFDGGGYATSQSRLNYPAGVNFVAGLNRLWIADRENNRVVAYNVAAPADAGSAVALVGHPDGDGGAVWDTACVNGPADIGVHKPWSVAIDAVSNRLFVGEFSPVSRVASYPLTSGGSAASSRATNVLGAPDLWHCGVTALASNPPNLISLPTGMSFDNARNRLFVSDLIGGRVAVFDFSQGGLVNGMSAVAVLGRATLDAGPEFYCTPTASHFCYPTGTAYDETRNRLFVADFLANRVVVFEFDGGAVQTGMSANYVLGQENFIDKDAGLAANRFDTPVAIAIDSVANRFYVSDSKNNRVVMFDLGAGIASGMAAVRVFGQSDFQSKLDGGGVSQLSVPGGLAIDSARRRLFVADSENNRIQVWDTTGATNGAATVNVIGQRSRSSTDASVTQAGMRQPLGLALHPNGKWLWVAEIGTGRVLSYDVGR